MKLAIEEEQIRMDERRQVRLQGAERTKVHDLKYSGLTVQENMEYGKEVKKRVQPGWSE